MKWMSCCRVYAVRRTEILKWWSWKTVRPFLASWWSTRNYAAERSRGEYLLILDSDCILPETYLAAVEAELQREHADAFGGPDRAHDSFSDVQKAINYAMTSFFTTGGIRGGKKKMDKFYPRSFNMGVRAEVYKALGGFSAMRFGEDHPGRQEENGQILSSQF